MATFTKGQAVEISPAGYPRQKWRGEVLRKTPNGYSVAYEAWGIRNRATFSPGELSALGA